MAKQHWKGSVLLAPVPPTLVSCGTMEHPNVLTIAWTGVLATHPPMTYISVRPSRYSYELFHEYDVDRILRIGTAGGVADHVQLRDVILGQAACTDSNYAAQYALPGTYAPIASFSLLEKAYQTAKRLDIPVQVGNLFSTDVFYREPSPLPQWAKMGVLATEMESAALYMNAAAAGKEALCIVTVSDCPLRGEFTTAEERQTSFTDMMRLALETACA